MNDRVSVLVIAAIVVATIMGVTIGRYYGGKKTTPRTAQATIDAEVAEATKRGTLQELPPGKKLVGITLTKSNTIAYLVRPMRTDETPEVYQLTAYETDPPAWVIREHAVDEKK